MTRMALDDELEKIVGQGRKVSFDRIDMELQEHIERRDIAKHMLVRNLKLTAGILATQDRIANGQGADRKCPCCGASKETQNHILGHCPHKDLVRQREKMIQEIHTTIADELGRHVQRHELELIKQIWNEHSVKGVAGHTDEHTHEEYDWSDTTDPTLKQYMTNLTEAGATKMWDGWFTKYWTPILQDMIKRKRTNTTQSHAYEIARKAAYKIRITIKQNLYEIWKIRSQIKHEPNEKKTWTKEQVQDMIHKLNRKLGRNVLWTAEELMKRRKRKLNEWMERAKEDLSNREQEEQERRTAIRTFGSKYRIFAIQNPRTPTTKPPKQEYNDQTQRRTEKKPSQNTTQKTRAQETKTQPDPFLTLHDIQDQDVTDEQRRELIERHTMIEHDAIEQKRNVFGFYHARHHKSANRTKWSKMYNEQKRARETGTTRAVNTVQRKRKREPRNRDTDRDKTQAGEQKTQEARNTRKTRKLRQNTITYYHGQPKRKRKEETADTEQQETGQKESGNKQDGNKQDRKKRKGIG